MNPDPLGLFPYAMSWVAYLATLIGITFFLLRLRTLLSWFKRGQSDPTRRGDRSLRLRRTLAEVFGHSKMLNFTVSGIAHWFVMIGFVALLGTLITAYGQTISPQFHLPVIGTFIGYELFVDAIAWLTGIGIVALIGIRQGTRLLRPGKKSRFFGSGQWKAYFVEVVILAIVFCVITLRGLEGALAGVDSFDWNYALTMPAVLAFANVDQLTLEALITLVASIKIFVSMLWFIVIASNLTMGVAWHRFLAPFNIYFKRDPGRAPTLGALPEMLSHGKPIDFEDPKEDDIFGIGKSSDISWKGLLDMASCTECGRCQSQCPAWHTEKPLSPKLLIMAMRDHALTKVSSSSSPDRPIVGAVAEPEGAAITHDVLWSCTTCGACVNECPVDIEHVDHIVNMRRFQDFETFHRVHWGTLIQQELGNVAC